MTETRSVAPTQSAAATAQQSAAPLAPQSGSPAPDMERVLYEVKKVIVGQDHLLERLLVALLARGHILVEGVPGLAKTMAIKTLASATGGEFKRIQFTPDLVPSDLVGTRIYNQKTGEFSTSLGPVFANLLLADEINRAPAKVQSALLEVMQERQVTIGHETFKVPEPFLVLATQNPIETEGTYALPEAQVDRFMLKVLVGYPSPNEEFVIVERMTGTLDPVQEVLSTKSLLALQKRADAVYVDPALMEYAVRLATATRAPKAHGMPEMERYITYGASPRASINLILTARALAFIRGRDYALPQDVLDMSRDVLRHRLVLSFEALSDNVSADDILTNILKRVPVPVVPMREASHVRHGA
jgi:MoxR-like ATPase